MNNNDFLEALSRICNDPEFDNKFNNKNRKRKNAIKAGILCASALVAVIGTVLLLKGISAKRSDANAPSNNGAILINSSLDSATPFDELVSTDAPGLEQMSEPVVTDDEYNHGYDETQVSEINDPDESIIPESPIIIATPSVEPVVTPAPTATDAPQDTPVSTTDSRPTLKPTEEPETTADLPDDDPTETVFRFTSYESLITTLCEKNSEEHILFRDGINGKNYSGLFIELIDKLESENESLLLPYFDGELALIDSAREWQKITLFSEDLFGIPWLWFYCSIGGESYVICLSPLDVGLEIGDYNDFISAFYGDDSAYPMPSNKTDYSDIYSDIYSEELSFRDGSSCLSTVYELRTGRIQYRFILGNCIFSIWKYNGGSIPNQAWQKLSFDYYSE